ncbi:hypothetical protein NJC38_22040 [Pseudomonas sp. 21LCFQ010]|uniref:hypothetical protein n=1 Tax=Pseudomonas sp. 21LCFQ010 TaxID=2957506 RepID=UPI0020975649|nr:hypothetical protein [Pseudomonas sp. 21LCFQ010]MCO8164823.1 hypothetical protein [Pseudomonas sp. 21LCFQ010]
MFESVVKLYRSLAHPTVEGGVLSFTGPSTQEICDSIKECEVLDARFGKFEHVDFTAGVVELEFRLPSSEFGKFFKDLPEFIERSPSVGKGIFPKNFFIVGLNWASFDESCPPEILKVRKMCRFIELLAMLAVGVDKDSSPDHYNLFFALPPEGNKPPRSFLLPTAFTPPMVSFELQHVNLLEEIFNPKNQNKAHLSERKMMLCVAVADVLEKHQSEPSQFLALAREWKAVVNHYRANLQSYVYGFSFEKVRREVSQAEIEYGAKLNASLADISGKLLALPLSLAALVALKKAEGFLESVVVLGGILIVSVILWFVIHNQRLQVSRLLNSFNVVFEEFQSKISTYPEKLKKLLELTVSQVDKQGKLLDKIFFVLQFLTFLPVVVAVGMLVYSNFDVLKQCAKGFWVFLLELLN